MATPPCPCCGEPLEVHRTKTDKPHLVCGPCQVQTFVRGKQGVARFTERYGSAWRGTKAEPPPAPPAPAAAEPKGARRADLWE